MNLNALIKEYYAAKEKHERKIGRYNSSELYEIITNRLKPEDFLKEKKFDLQSYRNMYEGEIREMALKILLDASKVKYDYQTKKVKKFKQGFEIVCVADFLFPDYIVECKSPREFSGGIKEWNRPQLEAQFRLFNKPVYVGYVKSHMESKFYKYIPSDSLWKNIIDKVDRFNKEIKKEK